MFEAKAVSIKFNQTLVLENVSFRLPQEGLVLITGPSGAGKSTILNLLGGLIKPTKGQITYLGNNIQRLKAKQRNQFYQAEVGFLFQASHLIEDLSVRENIALGLKFSGQSNLKINNKVDKLLNEYQLSHLAKAKTSTLSGGERSRIALLRALIKEPRVILADEPTGALDANNAKIVAEFLAKISSDRLVVVVSHNRQLFIDHAVMELKIKNTQVTTIHYAQCNFPEPTKVKKKLKTKTKINTLVNRLLKNHRTQNILTIIALSGGLMMSVLMYGFNVGANATLDSFTSLYFAPYSLKVSKVSTNDIAGSNLKLTEMERPTYNEVLSWKQYVPSLRIEPSLTGFIDANLILKDVNGKVKNYEIGYFTNRDLNNLASTLTYPAENGEIIFINQMFSTIIEGDYLEIDIKAEYLTTYAKDTSELLYDSYKLNKVVKVVELEETEYANVPRVYFNYDVLKTELTNNHAAHLSYQNSKPVTWYQYLLDLSPKHPLSNYQWQCFVSNEEDYRKLISLGDPTINVDTPFEFVSPIILATETFAAYFELIKLALFIFWIIMMIGTLAIFVITVFAAIIDSSKDIAIFRILGANQLTIKEIFRSYNIILSLLSTISLCLLPAIEKQINNFLGQQFSLYSLININWAPLNGLNYSLVFLIIIILCLISEVLLTFTRRYYRNIDLVSELQSS